MINLFDGFVVCLLAWCCKFRLHFARLFDDGQEKIVLTRD